MSLSPLSSNIINLLSTEPLTSGKSGGIVSGDNPESGFANIFSEAMKNVGQTDLADKASAIELLTGQSDDMSGLLLDAQKAEIALSLALQIRNKALDAYSEIMRMSL